MTLISDHFTVSCSPLIIELRCFYLSKTVVKFVKKNCNFSKNFLKIFWNCASFQRLLIGPLRIRGNKIKSDQIRVQKVYYVRTALVALCLNNTQSIAKERRNSVCCEPGLLPGFFCLCMQAIVWYWLRARLHTWHGDWWVVVWVSVSFDMMNGRLCKLFIFNGLIWISHGENDLQKCSLTGC